MTEILKAGDEVFDKHNKITTNKSKLLTKGKADLVKMLDWYFDSSVKSKGYRTAVEKTLEISEDMVEDLDNNKQ